MLWNYILKKPITLNKINRISYLLNFESGSLLVYCKKKLIIYNFDIRLNYIDLGPKFFKKVFLSSLI